MSFLSLTLAKIGLINPAILDAQEIKLIETNDYSTADILRVSNIKVIQVDNVIFFLIKNPKHKSTCRKLIIFPVAHNNKILHLEESTIAVCKNFTIAVKNCTATIPTFCLPSLASSCALQLVSGKRAMCRTKFNNIPPIVEIDDGVVVVNDQTVKIEEKGEPPLIFSGTYLLLFEEEVKVNGTIYKNRNGSVSLTPGIPRSAVVNLTEDIEVLNIPYLHHSNLENLQHIQNLQRKVAENHYVSLTLVISLCGVFSTFFVVKRILKKRKLAAFNKSLQAVVSQTATVSGDGSN